MIFEGTMAMWAAVRSFEKIDAQLKRLVNRRVAWWNGCQFSQDMNAAVGSQLGISTEKLNALHDYAKSPLFNAAEHVALEYADAMTDTARDVDDALFARVREHYDEEQIAELTMLIAWENASSRFNQALRVPSAGLWKRA